MATTVTHAKNGSSVLSKCLHVLEHGRNNVSSVRRRAWLSDGAPAVDTFDRLSCPIVKGDLVLRTSDSTVHICKSAPTDTTAAGFTAIPG